ncbi:MAG: hypothetical protein M3O36_02360 [Myxococcota bacterium]|nr:hypothetical protein [Myxococcota bacterium]
MDNLADRLRDALAATRVISCADGVALAEINHVCVAIWRGAVTTERFERQRAALSEVVNRKPKESGFLCVIESSSKPPNDELRRASSAMIASHGPRLACVAIVIEGTGFAAALIRGVLSGMVLILRNREVPISYFASVWPGARWMSEYMPLASVEKFAMSVESVRSRLA